MLSLQLGLQVANLSPGQLCRPCRVSRAPSLILLGLSQLLHKVLGLGGLRLELGLISGGGPLSSKGSSKLKLGIQLIAKLFDNM
jgi:hypothetical protein